MQAWPGTGRGTRSATPTSRRETSGLSDERENERGKCRVKDKSERENKCFCIAQKLTEKQGANIEKLSIKSVLKSEICEIVYGTGYRVMHFMYLLVHIFCHLQKNV